MSKPPSPIWPSLEKNNPFLSLINGNVSLSAVLMTGPRLTGWPYVSFYKISIYQISDSPNVPSMFEENYNLVSSRFRAGWATE